jgi:hypothetical protein
VFSKLSNLMILGTVLNEIRGVVMAGPVMVALYRHGGAGIGLLLGVCTLIGIGLSVVVPLLVARYISKKVCVR